MAVQSFADYNAGLSDGRFGYPFGAGIEVANVAYREGYAAGTDDRRREPSRYVCTHLHPVRD